MACRTHQLLHCSSVLVSPLQGSNLELDIGCRDRGFSLFPSRPSYADAITLR